jgi:hypothetical protein
MVAGLGVKKHRIGRLATLGLSGMVLNECAGLKETMKIQLALIGAQAYAGNGSFPP